MICPRSQRCINRDGTLILPTSGQTSHISEAFQGLPDHSRYFKTIQETLHLGAAVSNALHMDGIHKPWQSQDYSWPSFSFQGSWGLITSPWLKYKVKLKRCEPPPLSCSPCPASTLTQASCHSPFLFPWPNYRPSAQFTTSILPLPALMTSKHSH